MVLDAKSSQEYPVNARFLGSALFLLYINDLLDVICNIASQLHSTKSELKLLRRFKSCLWHVGDSRW